MTVCEPPLKKQKQEYIYPNASRAISTHSISPRHPLNIKPSGNSFLATDPILRTKRNDLLGSFACLPDELIMEIIGYVTDVNSLKNLSHVSRIFYAFLYDEEVWKKLYIKNIQLYHDKPWLGSWRNTVLGIPADQSANLQLMDNLLCSDLIYRPFQCSQINYRKLFAKILTEEERYHQDSILGQLGKLPPGRIQRINESNLTLEEFNTQYNNIPFILTNPDSTRWPKWTFESLLQRFPDVKFRQEAVEWNLSKYSQYLDHNRDENPLYLFDCNSPAMQTIRQEYKVPQIFQSDLFSVFEGHCRPDHAWLIMGSARSGSTFHKDPNHTSAFNVAIQGHKLWVMLPPHISPPGVAASEDESEVTSPVGIAEWCLSGFFNDSLKLEDDGCLVGITCPGECMYVPAGWWHSVINIDDSIAITQNFIPESKLGDVLDFLKNKPGQISGFRPREVKSTLDYLIKDREIDNDDMKDYCEKFGNLSNGVDLNEDCGEIEGLPPMPIFEMFKSLLILNDKQAELEDGLKKLERIELKNYEKETGKSKTWEKLTEQPTTGGAFSFNFEESDDE
ncbi:uncharacterized protein J8A68_000649 [[Candida] subhashii]|uniref:JmjC domain-containing protein n=1 Tax=[Candida] subhashii TaxID=561895 RepID=A0A8J5V599_9ASCO|nr:uncharacterized protein J8A68_000649 [[Candida] subhashii]KAG7665824.1 hypothetical protein J8A68_000649 [[Candida] subhashii]